MSDYPPHTLPALTFTTAGPDGQAIEHRVDETVPISLRDRELLRALMTTAYRLLNQTETDARAADRSRP
ncbi:hypothetical protein ABT264_35140 [Streptomyces virginiae]|uniref:hypothetical protein n=1 Tax=Streptomyces virginiae TaxID=1961 RepID=UPI0033227A1B